MYGIELKHQRKTRKINQTQLAKAINVTQQAISLWEKNTTSPTIDICVKIADFYGISLDELIGRDIKKNW